MLRPGSMPDAMPAWSHSYILLSNSPRTRSSPETRVSAGLTARAGLRPVTRRSWPGVLWGAGASQLGRPPRVVVRSVLGAELAAQIEHLAVLVGLGAGR